MSITKDNMRLNPRITHCNPVNGVVQVAIPQGFADFFSQLLNTVGKRSDYFATCITCFNWIDGKCHKFNALPPPEIIANGCEYYDDKDIIPF